MKMGPKNSHSHWIIKVNTISHCLTKRVASPSACNMCAGASVCMNSYTYSVIWSDVKSEWS